MSGKLALGRRHLPSIAWLTVVWLLLWGDVTAVTVIGGILVSAVIVVLFPFPPVRVSGAFRPLATLALAARFLFDLVVASFQVAWLAVRPSAPPASAVIAVDLVSRSPLLQTLTGELISLVPGSLLVELDSDGRRIWLHVLDGSSPARVEQARRKARHQEHRLLAAIGGREELDESRRRLAEEVA